MVGVLNLIPLNPQDGFKILAAWLQLRHGQVDRDKLAKTGEQVLASLTVGAACACLLFSPGSLILVAVFSVMLVVQCRVALALEQRALARAQA